MVPIDHLWKEFTTKFNEAPNLTDEEAKHHNQMKGLVKKAIDDIFKTYGGEKDFNFKKDMPPIATLAFNMKQERDELEEKHKFVKETIQSKSLVRAAKASIRPLFARRSTSDSL